MIIYLKRWFIRNFIEKNKVTGVTADFTHHKLKAAYIAVLRKSFDRR